MEHSYTHFQTTASEDGIKQIINFDTKDQVLKVEEYFTGCCVQRQILHKIKLLVKLRSVLIHRPQKLNINSSPTLAPCRAEHTVRGTCDTVSYHKKLSKN